MGFKNRVSGQISSAASQFTKAVKAPFSNKFVQGALSKARSELAQVSRALGGLKIPVGIEKQVVSCTLPYSLAVFFVVLGKNCGGTILENHATID
ncbi:hypothetical protein [Bacillus massilinigeriensis]|uniref:hypothetical protein n=1 Tax=Bacillus mediterraneensis TaxID=1805474 RepID=UPI0008F89CD0|nr:hypothetical protein [Bacillus mediterraneensis]